MVTARSCWEQSVGRPFDELKIFESGGIVHIGLCLEFRIFLSGIFTKSYWNWIEFKWLWPQWYRIKVIIACLDRLLDSLLDFCITCTFYHVSCSVKKYWLFHFLPQTSDWELCATGTDDTDVEYSSSKLDVYQHRADLKLAVLRRLRNMRARLFPSFKFITVLPSISIYQLLVPLPVLISSDTCTLLWKKAIH